MTLPRFTKGQAGNLDFSTLNEAFEAIDNLRRGGERPPARFQPRAAAGAGPIMVKVSTVTTDLARQRWGWTEVELLNVPPNTTQASFLTYGVKSGGATSNGLATPIVGDLFGGETCMATRQIGNGGVPYYVPTIEPFEPYPAKILSYVTGASTGQWIYTVQKQYYNYSNSTFENAGGQFDCKNTVEYVADTASLFGVGFNKPSGIQTLNRSPVRAGVIVQIYRAFDSDHLLGTRVFTMPNPYTATC